MARGAKAATLVLGPLIALTVWGVAFAPGAAAEQASQPAAAAAGLLDAGRFHSCAVLPAASVRCWGYGGDGALGYGNKVSIGDDETPAAAGPVDLGAGRGAAAVSAGAVHTCALLDDRGVRCWGFGGNGRLGYGGTQSIGDDESPASVAPVDLGTGRTARVIAAGRAHTCAVLDDGAARCWGFGFDGRLGYGNNVPNSSNSVGDDETPGSVDPVVLGEGRTAAAVTLGDAHTCALLDNGAVRCWGFGGNGQLGYGNTDNIGDDETPASVGPVDLGPGRRAVAIAAGDFHTCAVLDTGSVRCWGYNGNGRLGYATSESVGDNEPPAAIGPVDLGPRRAVAITAGADHTCALLDDGSVRCWGYGSTGALGYANTTTIGDDETPAGGGPVNIGAGRTAVAVSAGGDHTCVRLDDGSVRCWGRGRNGQLGTCARDTVGDDEPPAAAGPVDLGVPGSPGAGCPQPPPGGETPAPPVEPPSSPPTSELPYDLPETDPLRLQAMRAEALSGCRVKGARLERRQRRRARHRHRSPRDRARALRRIKRRGAQRRRRCVRRFGRTPGPITVIAAHATSTRSIVLSFQAAGSDGANPPAARGYLVKQATRPIRSRRDFRRAGALCGGTCRFSVTEVGTNITLTVTNLRSRRTYYYAVAARDNVSGRLGPRSNTVRARTLAD